MVYLTRKAEFSASHYYHSPEFSPEENQRVFGKCNNPNGHGHNYTVEVTIRGPVNPETGMVTGLDHLDRVVSERVIQRFDHQHLNYDKAFAETVTTGENLVLLLWELLEKAVPEGTLWRCRADGSGSRPSSRREARRSTGFAPMPLGAWSDTTSGRRATTTGPPWPWPLRRPSSRTFRW